MPLYGDGGLLSGWGGYAAPAPAPATMSTPVYATAPAPTLGSTSQAGSVGGVAFDPQAYLRANPDVAAAGMDPWTHYQRFGVNEGRAFTGIGGTTSTPSIAATSTSNTPIAGSNVWAPTLSYIDPFSEQRMDAAAAWGGRDPNYTYSYYSPEQLQQYQQQILSAAQRVGADAGLLGITADDPTEFLLARVGDRSGAGGATYGGLWRDYIAANPGEYFDMSGSLNSDDTSHVLYRREGDQLVPVQHQNQYGQSSLSFFGEGLGLMAALIGGAYALEGAGAFGATEGAGATGVAEGAAAGAGGGAGEASFSGILGDTTTMGAGLEGAGSLGTTGLGANPAWGGALGATAGAGTLLPTGAMGAGSGLLGGATPTLWQQIGNAMNSPTGVQDLLSNRNLVTAIGGLLGGTGGSSPAPAPQGPTGPGFTFNNSTSTRPPVTYQSPQASGLNLSLPTTGQPHDGLWRYMGN